MPIFEISVFPLIRSLCVGSCSRLVRAFGLCPGARARVKRRQTRAGGRAFSTQQERNLGLLKQLLDLSLDENQAIAHFILSFEDQQRAASFLQDYRLAGGALLRQQIAQD